MNAKNSLLTARITPEQYDFLSQKQFKNKQQAVATCIDLAMNLFFSTGDIEPTTIMDQLGTLQKIRQYSTREVEDIFNDAEKKYITRVLMGVSPLSSQRCNRKVLIAHFDEANTLNAVSIQLEINYLQLRAKTEKLTPSQVDAVYCLYSDKNADVRATEF